MMRSNRVLKDTLWALALLGLVAGFMRLVFGLGLTTNLSDAVPWGLWKILNMVAGVALSTSGFTVGFLVYVLRRERYRPLVKPAILLAFLGYGSSCLALLFDIGLPERFWHPFVMWNEHSFLFEVFWCVMLYFTVTAIELLPVVLERLRAERAVRWLHRIAFGVVVVGISLSSLHHSSLGSLFLVTPLRLHGLWYSSLLPLFFILSAIGGGLMCLVLVRVLHARWYDPTAIYSGVAGGEGRDFPTLRGLASIAAGVLAVYLALKLGDLLRTGAWQLLVAGTWESWLYIFELAIATILPVALLVIRRARRSPAALTTAALCATTGLALNRLNVGIFGYWRDAQTIYFPSLAEWALSIGVIAAAGLAFLYAAEQLPIFSRQLRVIPVRRFRASFDAFTHVWSTALASGLHRVTVIAVIALPLGWVLMYPPYRQDAGKPVEAPTGLDAMRAVLRLDGDRAGVHTDFPHAEHQQRLGGDQSCATCHHVSLPGDRSTPCSRCHRAMLEPTDIFDHKGHALAVAERERLGGLHPQNRSCALCHEPDRPKSRDATKACFACHEKDMWLAARPDPDLDLASASGFLDAMHGTCLDCHRREQARGVKPRLAECGSCHPSLQPREWLVTALAERATPPPAREAHPSLSSP